MQKANIAITISYQMDDPSTELVIVDTKRLDGGPVQQALEKALSIPQHIAEALDSDAFWAELKTAKVKMPARIDRKVQVVLV